MNKNLNGISISFNATEIFVSTAWLTDTKVSEPKHTPHPFYSISLSSHLSSPPLKSQSLFIFPACTVCSFTSCVITINNQQDRTCVVQMPHLGCVVSNHSEWWQPKHLHTFKSHNVLKLSLSQISLLKFNRQNI